MMCLVLGVTLEAHSRTVLYDIQVHSFAAMQHRRYHFNNLGCGEQETKTESQEMRDWHMHASSGRICMSGRIGNCRQCCLSQSVRCKLKVDENAM